MSDGGLGLTLGDIGAVDDVALENRARLVRLYREIEAGNMAALADILDDDVRFWQAAGLPYTIEAVGKAETLAGLMATFASWEDTHVVIDEIAVAGDIAIAYLRFEGVGKGTGRRYSGRAAEVFRFRDGKVIELRPIYWDTHAARAALVD